MWNEQVKEDREQEQQVNGNASADTSSCQCEDTVKDSDKLDHSGGEHGKNDSCPVIGVQRDTALVATTLGVEQCWIDVQSIDGISSGSSVHKESPLVQKFAVQSKVSLTDNGQSGSQGGTRCTGHMDAEAQDGVCDDSSGMSSDPDGAIGDENLCGKPAQDVNGQDS